MRQLMLMPALSLWEMGGSVLHQLAAQDLIRRFKPETVTIRLGAYGAFTQKPVARLRYIDADQKEFSIRRMLYTSLG